MLKTIRRTLAVLFFVGTTLLFLDFTGTASRWMGWMAKVQFLPALLAANFLVVAALVVLTLVLGRIYCSVVCPLGVMQDLIAWVGRRGKRKPYSYSKGLHWLRQLVLAVFVVAMVAGVGSLVALLAPYSSYGRIAQNLLQPVWLAVNNLLAWAAEAAGSVAFYSVDVWLRSWPTFVVAALTLLLLGVLAWRNGRTYCNTVCPVGTVLGALSKFSLFRIIFDKEKCRKCGKCSSHCKAACIDFKTMTVDNTRCVVCGDCLEQCAFGALSYGLALRKGNSAKGENASKATDSPSDTPSAERRAFLVGAASAVAASALAQANKKVDGGLAVIEDKVVPERRVPVVPPGALSVSHFAHHCTACQLCVAECPNGVLRPSADLLRLMQPEMSFERGHCRPECSRCSQVCPTGAILPISPEEKSSISVGHAVWVKENCLPAKGEASCGNCARHCPTGAIMMTKTTVNGKEAEVPAIDAERCIGCGACEELCPARPLTAIYVEGNEQHRVV